MEEQDRRGEEWQKESHILSFGVWCEWYFVETKAFVGTRSHFSFHSVYTRRKKVSATRMTDLRRQRVPRNQSCTLGHTFRTHFQDTVFLSSVFGRNEETKDLSHREKDKKRHPRHLSCLFSFLLFHFFWIWLVFSFLSTSWYLIRLLPSSCL